MWRIFEFVLALCDCEVLGRRWTVSVLVLWLRRGSGVWRDQSVYRRFSEREIQRCTIVRVPRCRQREVDRLDSDLGTNYCFAASLW